MDQSTPAELLECTSGHAVAGGVGLRLGALQSMGERIRRHWPSTPSLLPIHAHHPFSVNTAYKAHKYHAQHRNPAPTCLVRSPQDGSMFKARVPFAPYFYIRVQVGAG